MMALAAPGAPSVGPEGILEVRSHFARTELPGPLPLRGLSSGARGGGKVRVAYLSAYFDRENWMKPVWAALNRHDRDRFEIHLLSDAESDPPGGFAGRRPHPSDAVHRIRGLSNEEAARLVGELGIDLLVDLNAWSDPSRLGLLALRPAPLQLSWFNAYATTGLDTLDALVGDAVVAPPGEDRFFREPVERLPGCCLAFEVGYDVPEVSPPSAASGAPVTFGSFASQYKVGPAVTEAWARVLSAVPGSRLLLRNRALGSATNREWVRRRFARLGIEPGRLVLEGPAPHRELLERYGAVDVALDTFPYGGGTTTTEALWQGVPVATFRGDRWAARTSETLLRHAGLGADVADDEEGFVRTAVRLAAEASSPAGARRRAGARESPAKSAACDAGALAEGLEELYVRLCRSAATRPARPL